MSQLNYSKWDNLEASDESDNEQPTIEQRSAPPKREKRKDKISKLEAEIKQDAALLEQVEAVLTEQSAPDASPEAYFRDKLRSPEPSDSDNSDSDSEEDSSPEDPALKFLRTVQTDAKTTSTATEGEAFSQQLLQSLKSRIENLKSDIASKTAQLGKEKEEQEKNGLKDVYNSKYVPATRAPSSRPNAGTENKSAKQEYEVLNPKSSASKKQPSPQMTPTLRLFAEIPMEHYQQSFEFIQQHRDVVVPGASDALLTAAFDAESEGKSNFAKRCIHQSLLLQYSAKLGPDGVQVFFRKMTSGDKRAEVVFLNDVENTYYNLIIRVRRAKAETAAGTEKIKLVPESPDQVISFNVPLGPPAEQIVIRGPGAEDMNVEEVRKMLLMRWEVFQTFPRELQIALSENNLVNVNRSLAVLPFSEAQKVVGNMDRAGILSFTNPGFLREREEAANAKLTKSSEADRSGAPAETMTSS